MESIMKLYSLYIKNMLIKIFFLLCCIKKTDISNMLESGVLKEICMIEGRLNVSLKGRLHFFGKKTLHV